MTAEGTPVDDLRSLLLAFRSSVFERLDVLDGKVDKLSREFREARDQLRDEARTAAVAWANDSRDYRDRMERRLARVEARLAGIEGREAP